jgi:hypothetical protein
MKIKIPFLWIKEYVNRKLRKTGKIEKIKYAIPLVLPLLIEVYTYKLWLFQNLNIVYELL